MDDYVLAICKGCGNKGLLKKVAQYEQQLFDYHEDQPIDKWTFRWVLLECPVCKDVSLLRYYGSDFMIDRKGDRYFEEELVYPAERSFPHVPKDILKSYESAVRTAKIDRSVSMIAIRAVLEKICKERGTNRKNLEAMLKQMVEKHILPETLDQCGFIIRKMGNNGAHGDDDSMTTIQDVEELIDFLETIMYYIYELPEKVRELNQKYNLKMEEREPKESDD